MQLDLSPRLAWTVAAGVAILLVLFGLTAVDAFGQASLWENAHWTWAALVAAASSVIAFVRCDRNRSVMAWLAAASILTLLGSVTYDAMVATGAFTIPAAYDPMFLFAYPLHRDRPVPGGAQGPPLG